MGQKRTPSGVENCFLKAEEIWQFWKYLRFFENPEKLGFLSIFTNLFKNNFIVEDWRKITNTAVFGPLKSPKKRRKNGLFWPYFGQNFFWRWALRRPLFRKMHIGSQIILWFCTKSHEMTKNFGKITEKEPNFALKNCWFFRAR